MRSLDPSDLPSPPSSKRLFAIGSIAFIVLSLSLTISSWLRDRKISSPLLVYPAPLKLAETPKTFCITNSDGSELTLESLKNKWSMLVILSDECPSCMDASQEYNDLLKRWRGKLQIFGLVETGRWRAKERVAKFQGNARLAFPCWPDINWQLAKRLVGSRLYYPTEMLFDPKGRLAMFDDANASDGRYKPSNERWNSFLDIFIHGKSVPYPKTPYDLPKELLNLKIKMKGKTQVTLGDIASQYPTLVMTLIGSGCHVCNERVGYLTRLPKSVCHLVLRDDDWNSVKDDSQTNFDSLGALFGSADYSPIIRYLGFQKTPDTLLIQNKMLIGRIYAEDRVPPMLLAALNQVRPDITQYAESSGETVNR